MLTRQAVAAVGVGTCWPWESATKLASARPHEALGWPWGRRRACAFCVGRPPTVCYLILLDVTCWCAVLQCIYTAVYCTHVYEFRKILYCICVCLRGSRAYMSNLYMFSLCTSHSHSNAGSRRNHSSGGRAEVRQQVVRTNGRYRCRVLLSVHAEFADCKRMSSVCCRYGVSWLFIFLSVAGFIFLFRCAVSSDSLLTCHSCLSIWVIFGLNKYQARDWNIWLTIECENEREMAN